MALADTNYLMRHQHGQRHMMQQVSGNAAEHEFPQAGMTVAADHEQVGTDIGSIAEQDVGRRDAGHHRLFRFRVNPVAGQVPSDPGARRVVRR